MRNGDVKIGIQDKKRKNVNPKKAARHGGKDRKRLCQAPSFFGNVEIASLLTNTYWLRRVCVNN